MKHSQIIRAAKQYLEHPDKLENEEYSSPYVCDCIRYVGRISNNQHKAAEITNDISVLIDYKFGIDRWLVDVIGIDPALVWTNACKYGENTAAMQDYRLAWMESVAQDFEAWGL